MTTEMTRFRDNATPGQSGEVVGAHPQDEAGPHALDAAKDGLGLASDTFCPAEGLFDPLAVLERPVSRCP
jgi:hypothetical protein